MIARSHISNVCKLSARRSRGRPSGRLTSRHELGDVLPRSSICFAARSARSGAGVASLNLFERVCSTGPSVRAPASRAMIRAPLRHGSRRATGAKGLADNVLDFVSRRYTRGLPRGDTIADQRRGRSRSCHCTVPDRERTYEAWTVQKSSSRIPVRVAVGRPPGRRRRPSRTPLSGRVVEGGVFPCARCGP